MLEVNKKGYITKGNIHVHPQHQSENVDGFVLIFTIPLLLEQSQ